MARLGRSLPPPRRPYIRSRAATVAAGVNLCPNPAAGVDLTGVTAILSTGASITPTRVTGLGTPWERTNAARATAPTGGAYTELRWAPYVSSLDLGGNTYTSTIQWSVSVVPTGNLYVLLVFLDAAGALLDFAFATPTAVANAVARTTVVGTAPSGTRQVAVWVRGENAASGWTITATACRYDKVSNAALTYADGDSVGWGWYAAVGASVSASPAPHGTPEVSHNFVGDADGALTVADTGQSYALFHEGDGAVDPVVRNGAGMGPPAGFTAPGPGVAAGYAFVSVAGPTTWVGGMLRWDSSASTGASVALGAFTTSGYQATTSAPIHLSIAYNFLQFSVFNGGIGDFTTLTPVGGASSTVNLTAMARDGSTTYRVDVTIDRTVSRAWVTVGSDPTVVYDDPRIASIPAATYPFWEYYIPPGETDIGRFTQVWADANVDINPALSSLATDFTTMPAFFDGNFGSPSIVAGQGSVPTINAYAAFATSAQRYTFVGDTVYVQVPLASGTTASRQNSIKIEVDATNSIEMMLDGGVFKGRVTRAGATTDTTLATYSATTHAWWRMRESGGTVYWDTSPDGSTWTNLGSTAHLLTVTSVRLLLQAGHWNAADSDGPNAVYDNLNTPGGTNYTPTVVDAAGASDTASAVAAYAPTAADAVGVVDATSSSASYAPSVADTAGAVDAVTTVQGYAQTVADSAGASDAASSTATTARAAADTAGAVDAVSTTASYAPSVSDAASASDTVTTAQDYAQSTADTAGASDTITVTSGTAQAVVDTAGATDAVSATASYVPTVGDAAGASDTASSSATYAQAPADTAGVTDTASSAAATERAAGDAAAVSDTVATAQGYGQTVADGGGAVDAVSTAGSYAPSVGDAAGAADTVQVSGSGTATLADAAGASDTVTPAAAYTQVVADTAGATDALTPTLTQVTALGDAAGVSDTVTATATTTRAPADAIGMADAVTPFAGIVSTVSDAAGTTDAVTQTSTAARTLADTAGAVDAVTRSMNSGTTGPLGRADEVDTSIPLRVVAIAAVPTALDTSLPMAVELDTAYSEPTTTAISTAPLAPETDSATTVNPLGVRDAGTAAEWNLALPLTPQVDDGAYAAAISAADRAPVFVLKADWNRNGLYDHAFSDLTPLVEQVSVDRSLEGTLPAEVGLVEGYASAALSVTLSGRWSADNADTVFDPVDVFAPYRSDSPLFGKPVLQTPIFLETGFISEEGTRLTRRFTGTVSQVHPQSLARTVELHALDPVARLRNTVTLSGVAMLEQYLTAYGPDAYRSRMNSQWLIDFALRANGIYTSPPARDDAILSVTGHGSMIPEIGWGGAPQEYYPTYRGEKWWSGRFGGALATTGGDYGRWWLTDQVTAASGTGFGFSTWMGLYPAGSVSGRFMSIDMTTDASYFVTFGIGTDGRPYVGSLRAGVETKAVPTAFTPPSTGLWFFVGVHVRFTSTQMIATFRIGQTTYTSTVNTGTRSGNWKPGVYMNYSWPVTIQNFQMWKSNTAPTAPWQGEDPNWVPQADLDPGVNELTGVPELIGVDAWELIKAVTDAEGSTFQFDEFGRPQFRTSKGDTYYGRVKKVGEVISADHNLADLASTTDETTIRNVVNIKTKAQLLGDWEDYYSSPSLDAFNCDANSTTYFEVDLPTAAYEIPPPLSTMGCTPNLLTCWDYAGGAGFIYFYGEPNFMNSVGKTTWSEVNSRLDLKPYIRASISRSDDPTQWVGFGVQIRVVRLDPWRMQIIINNQNEYPVRFATAQEVNDQGQITTPGEPALVIPARIVHQGPEQLETYTDNGSVATYGPSSFDVGGSDDKWRQAPQGFRPLATEVLASTAYPVPVLEAIDVPHDPRRKLNDRVLLQDPSGLGEVAASIVGLRQTYEPDGARDQLTVRPVAPPGLGVLDDATHGLLDATLILGP